MQNIKTFSLSAIFALANEKKNERKLEKKPQTSKT